MFCLNYDTRAENTIRTKDAVIWIANYWNPESSESRGLGSEIQRYGIRNPIPQWIPLHGATSNFTIFPQCFDKRIYCLVACKNSGSFMKLNGFSSGSRSDVSENNYFVRVPSIFLSVR